VFYEFVTNKALIIPFCAWAIAQLLKLVITLIRERRLEFRLLFASGGMPSSHSATVCALTTTIGMISGVDSIPFGISIIFAIIVMYDSAGVRQSVGRQAVVLNRIMQELRTRRPIAELEKDLREFIGHTAFQVIIGGMIGIIVAWAWIAIAGI